MAVTWKKLAYEEDVVTKATFNAKGDILSASGDDTPLILAVGTDGQCLIAASGEATGLDWGSPTAAAHAVSHKDGGDDEILLNEFGEPTGNVAIDGQQLTDQVGHTVADNDAKLALTPLVGKIIWQTDELAFYACTVAA